MTLAARLRRLRIQRGLSQSDLAAALHTTRMAYTQYEAGSREPGLQALTDLADFYQVSADYLLGRSPVPGLPDLSDEESLLLSRLQTFTPDRRKDLFRPISLAVAADLLAQAEVQRHSVRKSRPEQDDGKI